MKKVLITGGSKGIGLETVKLFLTKKYFVYSLGRNFNNYPINSNDCKNIIYDLSNINGLTRLIQELEPIDILINAAGIMKGCAYDAYLKRDKEQMIKINLEAPLELIKLLTPNMIKNKWGRIINISSMAGQTGHPDIWYGITKAGLINATTSLSYILKKTGITVNTIAPGPVNTNMMATVSEQNKQYLRNQLQVTGAYLEPQKIAQAIYWLASNEAEGINGSCITTNPVVAWK